MGLTDVMKWASGTDLLPDAPGTAPPVGHRTFAELSQAGELGGSPSPAKFVTPGGGRGPRAGEITPHSTEYADLQRAIEAAEIASKHTPRSAKTKQMRLQKLDGSSFDYHTPASPGSPAGPADEMRERKAQMQQMLDAGVITPGEYTKMVAGLRAEAALTPAKQVQAPAVQTADETTASPIFTVDDTMTEPELAALAAERAEAQSNVQAKKPPPNFTGSPATAVAAAINSGLSAAAAARRQPDDHEQTSIANKTVDTKTAQVPPPNAVAVDSSVTDDVSTQADAVVEDDLPTTPMALNRSGTRTVEKSPASAKADGVLARWHKWDLEYARDFMQQQMGRDELRQLALEFGPCSSRREQLCIR